MPTQMKRKLTTTPKNHNRVILLLDLDCFYAQCECVRLGFNVITTCLALLQWNATLAVTYPARTIFGIKRGDTWNDINKKVEIVNNKNKNAIQEEGETQQQQQCYAIHVPVFTTNSSATHPDQTSTVALASSTPNEITNEYIDDEYEKNFILTSNEQEKIRIDELGVRRSSTNGKASIERYRIASRRIFETVLEWIDEHEYNYGKIELERASIDEFFLDVTDACYCISNNDTLVPYDDINHALQSTKFVGQQQKENDHHSIKLDDYDPETKAIQVGCYIAHCIRKRVFEKLGFTLSAGVSYNKTIAKLTTTYGKPNGQAVTYPMAATNFILHDTEIRKCRNLGGKLGKRIIELLPQNVPTTVGAIAKYLSLMDLNTGLSGDIDTAKWVYNISRGIDEEPVLSKNESALPKSITCFKALPFQVDGHAIENVTDWIRLLAQELISRVERDSIRHHRYPRSCSVQYAHSGRQNKSIRFHYPPQRLVGIETKVQSLLEQVPKLILGKEGIEYRINRIGLCATDFVEKVNSTNDIQSYFAVPSSANVVVDKSSSSSCEIPFTTEKIAPSTREATTHSTDQKDESIHQKKQPKLLLFENKDLELAKKLQAKFNSENRLSQAFADKMERQVKSSERSKDVTSIKKSYQNVYKPVQIEKKDSKIIKSKTIVENIIMDGCGTDDEYNNQDYLLAKKLQASYDNEVRILERENWKNSLSTNTRTTTTTTSYRNTTTRKSSTTNDRHHQPPASGSQNLVVVKKPKKGIDSFFKKKI